MTDSPAVYFVYGLCTMFYAMTSWLFWRRDKTMLSRLVAVLMAVIGLECIKDMLVINLYGQQLDTYSWQLMTAVDMVAEPIYAFILIELVRPGSVSPRLIAIQESPFVILPLLYSATGIQAFYDILIGLGMVYGTWYLIWTAVQIPRYNRHLKERFSYSENINLNWLRVILYSFYVILALWIVDCLVFHWDIEMLYLSLSLVIWMLIDYFLYKHESVIDELGTGQKSVGEYEEETAPDNLDSRIRRLFSEEQIYLNPMLKVSDIATMLSTNRTYVSNHINREMGMTFYDYVNGMRVDHARRLLRESGESIKSVAIASGFSGASAFTRAFKRLTGMTPTEYRQRDAKASE